MASIVKLYTFVAKVARLTCTNNKRINICENRNSPKFGNSPTCVLHRKKYNRNPMNKEKTVVILSLAFVGSNFAFVFIHKTVNDLNRKSVLNWNKKQTQTSNKTNIAKHKHRQTIESVLPTRSLPLWLIAMLSIDCRLIDAYLFTLLNLAIKVIAIMMALKSIYIRSSVFNRYCLSRPFYWD